jgi:hypothetical protein
MLIYNYINNLKIVIKISLPKIANQEKYIYIEITKKEKNKQDYISSN